ncbi:hypothetical protein [Sphingobium sp. AEW4]|uniref:hypothetical protein n=1 Tax=Sphingobium sp. AEW4 TaxID=2116625 RepID=UPI0015E62C93|nr:hypothetical protein [Sphingobium sp. AEW4]MBG6119189.1 hypothetical protein [Sphingobium sp. JAI105]
MADSGSTASAAKAGDTCRSIGQQSLRQADIVNSAASFSSLNFISVVSCERVFTGAPILE